MLIVLDAPTSFELEHVLGSLADDAIVAIPYSEDPLYDALKREFSPFGTIGANAATGPHQFWWGGHAIDDVVCGDARACMPLIVSCYAPALTGFNKVRRLVLSAETLDLRHAISQSPKIGSWEASARAKAQCIWDSWRSGNRPVLWVEPDSLVQRRPLLPISVDCDFAVHRRTSGAFDSSALYFNRSPSSEILLQTWLRLCTNFPGVSDSSLLQQAWLLVTAQRDIETLWLPRTFCQSVQTLLPGDRPIILKEDTYRTLASASGEQLPLAEKDGSSNTPDAQLVVAAHGGTNGPIAAIVRGADPMTCASSSKSIEDIASAFIRNSGGFSHLEIVVCRSETAFSAAVDAAAGYWIIVTDVGEWFDESTFQTFGQAIRDGSIARPMHENSRFGGADASFGQLGHKLTNVKSSGVFLMRAPGPRARTRPSLFLI